MVIIVVSRLYGATRENQTKRRGGVMAACGSVVQWRYGNMDCQFFKGGKIPGLGIKDPKTTCKPRTSTICFMKFFIKPRSFRGFIFSLMLLPPIKMSQNELELFLSPLHFFK